MEKEILYDEVFDAQEHFRLILDSMARPGKINVIPMQEIDEPITINNASALIAFALLNTDVTFCTINDNEAAEFIALHTSAKIADIHTANFVFIDGLQGSEFISALKTGTLPYPEDSATIIADVTRISEAKMSNSIAITLKGPGISGTETVYVSGLNTGLLDELKQQNLEFPLGIDLILTDSDNHMICIPRSNDFSYTSL